MSDFASELSGAEQQVEEALAEQAMDAASLTPDPAALLAQWEGERRRLLTTLGMRDARASLAWGRLQRLDVLQACITALREAHPEVGMDDHRLLEHTDAIVESVCEHWLDGGRDDAGFREDLRQDLATLVQLARRP